MKLRVQKRLAAQLLKCGQKRIVFDTSRLEDIKESITKADVKSLIGNKVIWKMPLTGISRARARKRTEQKRKGRQKGKGSRKGKRTARLSKKKAWMIKARVQRKFLKLLQEKGVLTTRDYQMIYRKIKGGFFRSKRHIKLFIEERSLGKKI